MVGTVKFLNYDVNAATVTLRVACDPARDTLSDEELTRELFIPFMAFRKNEGEVVRSASKLEVDVKGNGDESRVEILGSPLEGDEKLGGFQNWEDEPAVLDLDVRVRFHGKKEERGQGGKIELWAEGQVLKWTWKWEKERIDDRPTIMSWGKGVVQDGPAEHEVDVGERERAGDTEEFREREISKTSRIYEIIVKRRAGPLAHLHS